MFKKNFKVVEIRDNGLSVTHYLTGKSKDVKRDIKTFKEESKQYELLGKNGMVVWF